MKKAIFICLFALLGVAQATWATEYITDVMIAVGKKNKNNKVNNEGWTAIEKDLNAGAGGAYVFLLYKTGTNKDNAITDFYLKTGSSPESLEHNGRTYYPAPGVGGTNLNYDTDGTKIYLFYTKGNFDDGRAVTSISFNGTASGGVTRDDTGIACDLNKGAHGEYIYMHVTYPQVDNFPYVERSWDSTNKKLVEETKTKSISDGLTRLDGTNNELAKGWYVVDNNVTYNNIIEINGDDVNIIVADGMKLNASKGIRIAKDCKLKIYGQSAGTGLVYAHANAGTGIGGPENNFAGRLEIHGGTIDAQAGSKNNAGIGSGNGSNAGFQSITIYGGTVKAKGGSGGAGIGSGKGNTQNERQKNVGPIYIYGGTVYANGGANGAGIGGGTSDAGLGYITDEHSGNGDIYINGGNVYATGGENAPGIGSGSNGHLFGTISIYGANVIATGNKNADGIGGAGSQLTINNHVTIENSTVKAIGKSDKSGIRCYDLRIKNSVVEAQSDKADYKFIKIQENVGYYNTPIIKYLTQYCIGNGMMILYGNSESDNTRWNWNNNPTDDNKARYVKIMPCDHQGATYNNKDDNTHTVSCNYCKNAQEAHSYDGDYCKCGKVKPEGAYYNVGRAFYNGTNYVGTVDKVYVSQGAEYTLPDCTTDIDGYKFAGWTVVHNLSEIGDRPMPSEGETLYPAGYHFPLTESIILVARYYSTNLFLSDDKDNESLLIDNMTGNLNVTLKGRTLWKDGSWNTLCLPFSLTDEELAESQLGGYTSLKELDVDGYYDEQGEYYIYHEKNGDEDPMETGYYNNTATLYSGEASAIHQTGFDATTGTLYLYFRDATSIEAGTPYLIKWATASPNYIENPAFNGVTISSIAPSSLTSADGILTFTGTYAPVEIGSTGDNTILYLGADNKLYWPSDEMTIGCQRAYFQLNGITAGNVTESRIVLNFGDSEASGITTTNITNSNNAWYDMQGRRLDSKPSRAGLYINNGKKIVIK